MLKKLTVKGFKSLVDVTVELPRLAVLFGPNGAGKTNFLDAIQALPRTVYAFSLIDAIGIRGRPFEAFSHHAGGLPALLKQQSADFTLQADVSAGDKLYRYRIQPSMHFRSGELIVKDEYLARLGLSGKALGKPIIELQDRCFIVRPIGKGRPREVPRKPPRSILSDRTMSGPSHARLDDVRAVFGSWRTYYFEPRRLMRQEETPMDVTDIGVHGEMLARYLYKLKAEAPKVFEGMKRTVRAMAPSVEAFDVTLDERSGVLDLTVWQNGTDYPACVLSEGTLRLLAFCAVAGNPWGGSLIALEEPENGVNPRRIDRVARVLVSLSESGSQVIVTSHSPLLIDAILTIQQEESVEGIGFFNVRSYKGRTQVDPFDPEPIFADPEVVEALALPGEDTVFQGIVLRGYLDEPSPMRT